MTTLKIGDREVGLKFTWRAIDTIGRGGVESLLRQAEDGAVGGQRALADLLVLAGGEGVTVDGVLDASVPHHVALTAVYEAWALALYGPRTPDAGKPARATMLRFGILRFPGMRGAETAA